MIRPQTPTGSFMTKVEEVTRRAARDLAVHQARGAGIEPDPVDRRLELALPDVADRLAHLAGDELRQATRFLPEQPCELVQDRRPSLAGGRRPIGAVERTSRGVDRRRQVLGRRRTSRRDQLTGRRVAALEQRPTCVAPTAVDVVANLDGARARVDHRLLRMASITTSTASFASPSSMVSGGLIFTTCS